MSQLKAINFYNLVSSAPKGRFAGIKRNYDVKDVLKLRGSVDIEHTIANKTANKLWHLIHTEKFVPALGALSGNQAVQMVKGGLNAIYLSGWQVAADAGTDTYPDQSLYPSSAGPELAKKINKALRRADQIECAEADDFRPTKDYYAPIVADAEAGFGGSLNCYEIMKAYIEAGVAGVHFEDQLGSEKKCGHLNGKVLIPSSENIRHLNAARLAADVSGTPTIIIARTDAESARLLTNDVDEIDHPFIDRQAGRTAEGFWRLKDSTSMESCIQRGIAYAPYCDMIWMETSHPSLSQAKEFAEGVRKVYPDKLFAYNCSPSFNWKKNLKKSDMQTFQKELGAMGFKYQFITLAGFHANSFSIFDLAKNYRERGMAAYSELQEAEFAAEKSGYTAVKHQREVGTGYFDAVATALSGGTSSTTALSGSTEDAQFKSTADEEVVTLTSGLLPNDENIISPDALRFLKDLHNQFDDRREKLLEERKVLQDKIDRGLYIPDFSPKTADIRNDDSWSGAEIPLDMLNRKVEITGPISDRKMTINALNSGARVFMGDFEDSNTPTWRNQVDGQRNLYDAIRKTISFDHPLTGKSYKLNDKHAVLNVRPRGLHLLEKNVMIHNKPISGSLFDFGIYIYNNAQTLIEQKTGPYFYLPKLQNAEEAKWWNDVFKYTEEKLNLPKGTIKCTVLIEHLLASFEMEEIIYNLKDYCSGLNCGRWDYIFSYIKVFRNHHKYLLPDRDQITMSAPFLTAYSQQVIRTSHKRNIAAIGGMATAIFSRDKEANAKAMNAVYADKTREANFGHDGCWIAHPQLLTIAADIFNNVIPGDNQIDKILGGYATKEELTAVPRGTLTAHGLRKNVSVVLQYLEAWLRGIGCVAIFNHMEDLATAELSRAQLFQMVKHGAKLEDGQIVTPELIKQVIATEVEPLLIKSGSTMNRYAEAAEMLENFTMESELSDFLSIDAYDKLVAEGR